MKVLEAKEYGSDVTIAIVASRFNQDITDAMLNDTLARLKELEVHSDHVTVVRVPGAVEIPLIAKHLAASDKYDAIITIGAVIRGETSHFDYVCDQVSQGCSQVMMQYDLPVVFGVLTTETVEQAQARINGKKSYKGREMADVALEMISLLQQVK